ncbi:Phosphatidylinositol 4-kinase alpha 1-like [Melia azedarach]|uniref:Phosphatidylinositol 4-kinase alpha 1-like n=1 Tax=Melia azedarach TaxID=155640 RepID=A0ACC1Y7E8_MELAZ|nr:Phosphatidylinositol 4-kinase alpha 1-like [Melia azedarach]
MDGKTSKSSPLAGIAQIAVIRGGQPLRVLLIPLKLLVLTACAQADTWGSSQGAMFESVMKTSCEIIESGWTKDRAPVDTFIMGLATSIRERSDYDEQGVYAFSLLDAVSRMATLGFEKSYRETVVLMTRSYLSKLASVGSTES